MDAAIPETTGLIESEQSRCEDSHAGKCQSPPEAASSDPDVLRAALIREAAERRRTECRANIQTEVVKLALDLLVREPDLEGFFGALTKTVVEESESHTCAVWLIDEAGERCSLWMAYVRDRLFTPPKIADGACEGTASETQTFPCETMAAHLFGYTPGWNETVEYDNDDARLPERIRQFGAQMGWHTIVATPLVLGGRNHGWMTVCSPSGSEAESQWWRVVVMEAIARQAALALHLSRLIDLNRKEERRKATLEERNRLARDIHDNLAQGFAAILMQLQAAQREAGSLPPSVAASVETAVELARIHLTEARRSVGALRPTVGERRGSGGRAEAARGSRPADHERADRSRPGRSAAIRGRRRARDHGHRAGGADQRACATRAPGASPSAPRRCARSACACRWPTTAAGSRASRRGPGSA